MFSKCLLRHGVVRVFVSSLVLVFVRAILSWCPLTWHIYIVYNILCLNISSIYITITIHTFTHNTNFMHLNQIETADELKSNVCSYYQDLFIYFVKRLMIFVQIKMQIAVPVINQNQIDFRRKNFWKHWVCFPEYYRKVIDA